MPCMRTVKNEMCIGECVHVASPDIAEKQAEIVFF